jgi:hypothetical protein
MDKSLVMFSCIRPLIAVIASLTLCLLAFANPVAAQDTHRSHGGGEYHDNAGSRGNSQRAPTGGAHGLHAPMRAPVAMQRDPASGYGLYVSGPFALAPAGREGLRGFAASANGLNTEPVRAGSLRADIERYNAERSGPGVSTQGRMDVPHPPPSYMSTLYTN